MQQDQGQPAPAPAPDAQPQVEAKVEVKEIDLTPFPMLTKKAFALPATGDDPVYQAGKQDYLSGPGDVKTGKPVGIYGAGVAANYEFKMEDCPFKQQFEQLINACIAFKEKYFVEMEKACLGLPKEFQPGSDNYVLQKLTANVKINQHQGLDVGDPATRERDTKEFFVKMKKGLEDVLYNMVKKLEEQPEGNVRILILRRIAAAYIHFADGFAACTAGAQGAISVQKNKWMGNGSVATWLFKKREVLVAGYIEGYGDRHPGHKTNVHNKTKYENVFYKLGAGIEPNVERYIGGLEELTAEATKDFKEKFPIDYSYETVCEAVAFELIKQYQATLEQYANKILSTDDLRNFNQEMKVFVDYRLCEEGDLTEEVDVQGEKRQQVNPVLSDRINYYCMEYVPLWLATEGYIANIAEYKYRVKPSPKDPLVKGQNYAEISLGELIKRYGAHKQDINTWRSNGDTLLTKPLREGKLFEFIALLKMVKPKENQQGAVEFLFNPSVTDKQGLTALAIVIVNPFVEMKSRHQVPGPPKRCLTPRQQNMAVKLLLEHPVVTLVDMCQSLDGCYLRDKIAEPQFNSDAFVLFWHYLPQKVRRHLQLMKLGREAAQAQGPVLEGLSTTTLLELGQTAMQRVESLPHIAEEDIVQSITGFANKKDQQGFSALMHVALAADFQKLQHLMLNVLNLDFAAIPRIKLFANLTDSVKPPMEKVRRLVHLPLCINKGDVGSLAIAKDLFLELVKKAEPSKDAKEGGVAAGGAVEAPSKDVQLYKKLLKIIFNQCNKDNKYVAFIKELAEDESDIRLRMALAEYAPQVLDLSQPRLLILPNGGKEKNETPLRLAVKEKDEKQLEQLVKMGADPHVEVKGDSAFALAASSAITDRTQQERLLRILLDSPKLRPDLLLQTAQSQCTEKAFAVVMDHVKSMERSDEPEARKQLALAYNAFLAEEKQRLIRQWDELKVGNVSAEPRRAAIEMIWTDPDLTPQDIMKKSGYAACDATNLQKMIAAVLEMKPKLTAGFKVYWGRHSAAQRLAGQGAREAKLSDREADEYFQRAIIAIFGSGREDLFRKKVVQDAVQRLTDYANQQDGAGLSAIDYAVRSFQLDKIERLFVAVKNIKLDKVFALPRILETKQMELVQDPAIQNENTIKQLIQLMFILKSVEPDYQKAKQLFSSLTADHRVAMPGQAQKRNVHGYTRLILMVANQCQQHCAEFFTALLVAETNPACLLALNAHIAVDLTRALPLAVTSECEVEVFKGILEVVKEYDEDEIELVEEKGGVAPAQADAALAQALKKQINLKALVSELVTGKDHDHLDQLAKLKLLLTAFQLVSVLQPYQQTQQNHDSARDMLIQLLVALAAKRPRESVVYYLLYSELADKIEPNPHVKAEDRKPLDQGGKILILSKELYDIIKTQFSEEICTWLSGLTSDEPRSGLFTVSELIAKGQWDAANAEIFEEKELHKITADKLGHDLNLLLQVHFFRQSPPHVFSELLQGFFQNLLTLFADKPDMRLIIIEQMSRYNPADAAQLFFTDMTAGGQLPSQAELMDRLKNIKSDEFLKHFFAQFISLIASKDFLKNYADLVWKAFDSIGYQSRLFVYMTTTIPLIAVTEPPLCHFMRTGQYENVERMLKCAAEGKPVDVGQADSQGRTALLWATEIKDQELRKTWVNRLLTFDNPSVAPVAAPVQEVKARIPGQQEQKVEVKAEDGGDQRHVGPGLVGPGPAEAVRSSAQIDTVDSAGNSAILCALSCGHADTAITLMQHAALVLKHDVERFKKLGAQKNKSGKSALMLAGEQKDPQRKQLILSLLEHVPLLPSDLQEFKSVGIRAQDEELNIPAVMQGVALLNGSSALEEAAIGALVTLCFYSGDYTQHSDLFIKLVKIIKRQCAVDRYQASFKTWLLKFISLPGDHNAVIIELIQAVPNVMIFGQNTPRQYPLLPYAVCIANEPLVKLALQQKINVNQVTTPYHETALLLAVHNKGHEAKPVLDEKQQEVMVRLLLEHKADISIADSGRCTVLDYAMHELCFLPAFLAIWEADEKCELYLKSFPAHLTDSPLAKQKKAFLDIFVVMRDFTQRASDRNLATAAYLREKCNELHAAVQVVTDDQLLIRIFNITKKKLPLSTYQVFMEGYLTYHYRDLVSTRKSFLLELFRQQGADLRFNRSGKYPMVDGSGLLYVIDRGDYGFAQELLEAKIFTVNGYSVTPLMQLAQSPLPADVNPQQRCAFATFLIAATRECKALNERDQAGFSALRMAIETNEGESNFNLIDQLLETKETDTTLTDFKHIVPVVAAYDKGLHSVVDKFFKEDKGQGKLKEYLFNIAYLGKFSPITPTLKVLAARSYYELYPGLDKAERMSLRLPDNDVEFYQELVNLHRFDNYPAIFACDERYYAYRVMLLQRSGQINSAIFEGETPFAFALRTKNKALIIALLKINPEWLNQKDDQGKSALYRAVEQRDVVLIQLLLSLPDIDTEAYCSTTGLTAAMLAHQLDVQAEQPAGGKDQAQDQKQPAGLPKSDKPKLVPLFGGSAVMATTQLAIQQQLQQKQYEAAANKFKQLFLQATGADAADSKEHKADKFLCSELSQWQQQFKDDYPAFCHHIVLIADSLPSLHTQKRLSQLLYATAFIYSAHVKDEKADDVAIERFKTRYALWQGETDVDDAQFVADLGPTLSAEASTVKLRTVLVVEMLVPALQDNRLALVKVLLQSIGGAVVTLEAGKVKLRDELQDPLAKLLKQPLPPDVLTALYADPVLKTLWPYAALIFADTFSETAVPDRKNLLAAAEQVFLAACQWPHPIAQYDDGIITTILELTTKGRLEILAAGALTLDASYKDPVMTQALAQAAYDQRDDVVQWLIANSESELPSVEAVPERKQEARDDEAAVRMAEIVVATPAKKIFLIDVNANYREQPIIFWVIAGLTPEEDSPCWRILAQIMSYPTWQEDQVDRDGRTAFIAMAQTGRLGVAAFKKLLSKVKLSTLLIQSKMAKPMTVMDALLAAAHPLGGTQADALLAVFTKEFAQLKSRIEFCQQFISAEQLSGDLSRLRAELAKLRQESQPIEEALQSLAQGHADHKEKSARVTRLKPRIAAVEKEVTSRERGLADYPHKTTLCEEAKRLAIEILKFYCQSLPLPQPTGVAPDIKSPATGTLSPQACAQQLLVVLQQPQPSFATRITAPFVKVLMANPALLEIYHFLFTSSVFLAPKLAINFVLPELTAGQSMWAVRHFVELTSFIEEKEVCQIIAAVKTKAKHACADFCEQVLVRAGLTLLVAKKYDLLEALITEAPLAEHNGRARPAQPVGQAFTSGIPRISSIHQLQDLLKNAEILFGFDVLEAIRYHSTLAPLTPFIVLAFAKAFHRGVPSGNNMAQEALKFLEYVLITQPENIESFAGGVFITALEGIYTGLTTLLLRDELQKQLTDLFVKAASRAAVDKVRWLLTHSTRVSQVAGGAALFQPAPLLLPAAVEQKSHLINVNLAKNPGEDPLVFVVFKRFSDNMGREKSNVSSGMSVANRYLDIVLQMVGHATWANPTDLDGQTLLERALSEDSKFLARIVAASPIRDWVGENKTEKTLMNCALDQLAERIRQSSPLYIFAQKRVEVLLGHLRREFKQTVISITGSGPAPGAGEAGAAAGIVHDPQIAGWRENARLLVREILKYYSFIAEHSTSAVGTPFFKGSSVTPALLTGTVTMLLSGSLQTSDEHQKVFAAIPELNEIYQGLMRIKPAPQPPAAGVGVQQPAVVAL